MTDQLLFDKLAYKDRLTASGIPDEQARALADAMHEALRESVATKADILQLKQEIIRLEHRIDLAVREMTIRVGSIVGGATALLIAIKFFGK